MKVQDVNKVLNECENWKQTIKTQKALKFSSARIDIPNPMKEETKIKISIARTGIKVTRTAEHNAKIGRKGPRTECEIPCTIDDGVTIYRSVKTLIAVHGGGKEGRYNPNRRPATSEEIKKWKAENET